MPGETGVLPHSTPGTRGPIASSERALAPDLARGVMLLLIALANASGVVFGGTGLEPRPEHADRALNFVMTAAVHARAYPVFGLLFGYGIVQLARRQSALGASAAQVRAILLRRHAWLFALGALHALLLYYGDFLGAYGIIGALATVLLLDRGDRVQRVVLWLWAITLVNTAVFAGLVVGGLEGAPEMTDLPRATVASLAAPTYLEGVRVRATEWPIHTATVVPSIVIAWLGMWAARRRLLEETVHRRLLVIAAVAGLGIAFAGGLPLALSAAGVVRADAETLQAMKRLHEASGMFGGPGYTAVVALAAAAASRSASRVVASAIGALAALGRRSLSGYLFQSAAWLALFAPYTLHLGGRGGGRMLAALGAASAVWLASLLLAAVMEHRGWRGPAEVLLRRLTYGRL